MPDFLVSLLVLLFKPGELPAWVMNVILSVPFLDTSPDWFFCLCSSSFMALLFFWFTGFLLFEAMARRSKNFFDCLWARISSSSFDSWLFYSASTFWRLLTYWASSSIDFYTLRTSSSVYWDFAVRSSLNFSYFSLSSRKVFFPSSSLSFSITMYSFNNSVSSVF